MAKAAQYGHALAGGLPENAGDLLPEMAVILSSATGGAEPVRAALDLAAARGDFDWPILVALSERERAATVLGRHFAALSPPHKMVSEGHAEALLRLGLLHEFRISEMDRQLDRLLLRFEEAELPVVLLKGAALWKGGYVAPVDRPMSDCDLLVRPEDAGRAWTVAEEGGWHGGVTGIPSETFDQHHHLDRMAGPGNDGLALEIHTDIVPPFSPFRFGAANLWERARPLEGFTHVHLPVPEHLLMHNCLHFAWSHCLTFGAWRCFGDTHALLAREELQMEAFLEIARDSRGGSCAFWTLYLARAWGGVEVEEAWLDELGRPVPRFAVPALRRHFGIRLSPLRHQEMPVRLDRRLWELAIAPGRSGHGRQRPWSGTGEWVQIDPGPFAMQEEVNEQAGTLVRLGRSIRYLAALALAR